MTGAPKERGDGVPPEDVLRGETLAEGGEEAAQEPPLAPAEAERALLEELARERYAQRAGERDEDLGPSPWGAPYETGLGGRPLPDDTWTLTPGYTRCPACGAPLYNGDCRTCGEHVELPPIPAWQTVAFLLLFALATAVFALWQGEGLVGLPLAFGGACCVMLALCVVWFWAAFRYGLDKRLLLRCLLSTMGAFVLDLLLYVVMVAVG